MEQPAYSIRLSLWQKETAYRLDADAVLSTEHAPLPYRDIKKIRIYESPGLTLIGGAVLAPGFKRCVIWPMHGRAIPLSTKSYLSLGRFEDRSAAYDPFVAALIREVAAANPATTFITGMPIALWLFWLFILAMSVLMVPLILLLIVGMLIEGQAVSAGLFFAALLLLSIAFAIVPLTRLVMRNRPHSYNPRGAQA